MGIKKPFQRNRINIPPLWLGPSWVCNHATVMGNARGVTAMVMTPTLSIFLPAGIVVEMGVVPGPIVISEYVGLEDRINPENGMKKTAAYKKGMTFTGLIGRVGYVWLFFGLG